MPWDFPRLSEDELDLIEAYVVALKKANGG